METSRILSFPLHQQHGATSMRSYLEFIRCPMLDVPSHKGWLVGLGVVVKDMYSLLCLGFFSGEKGQRPCASQPPESSG